METKKGMILPKRLTNDVMKSLDCKCVKSFEILREDYLKYYAIGNVVGKHVVPTYEDKTLIRDFDFQLFTKHYRDFFECLGYVNVFVKGHYICKISKGIYLIPVFYDMISLFEVMETCYKRIQ